LNGDGSRVAALEGPVLKVWEMQGANELGKVSVVPVAVAFSTGAGGEQLLMVDDLGRVLSWREPDGGTETICQLRELPAVARGRTRSVRFSPDGRHVGFLDEHSGTVKIWELSGGRTIGSFVIRTGGNGVLWGLNRDASRVAVLRVGRAARVRQVESGEQIVEFAPAMDVPEPVPAVLSRDGTHLAWLAQGPTEKERELKVFDLASKVEAVRNLVGVTSGFAVADGARRVAVVRGNDVVVIDPSGVVGDVVCAGLTTPELVALDGRGSMVAVVAPDDPYVKLWDAGNGVMLARFFIGPVRATRLAFDREGKWLAVGAADRLVVLMDLGELRRQLRGVGLDWRLSGESP
jgi:WD40 repeat protein